jgi:hypothetical protein
MEIKTIGQIILHQRIKHLTVTSYSNKEVFWIKTIQVTLTARTNATFHQGIEVLKDLLVHLINRCHRMIPISFLSTCQLCRYVMELMMECVTKAQSLKWFLGRLTIQASYLRAQLTIWIRPTFYMMMTLR